MIVFTVIAVMFWNTEVDDIKCYEFNEYGYHCPAVEEQEVSDKVN